MALNSKIRSRKNISKDVEADILIRCRRRCCLCYFVEHKDEACNGQIAHLDHDPSNAKETNLVYLCMPHHDQYDSRTSQSKNWTVREVRAYRDDLVAELIEKHRLNGRSQAQFEQELRLHDDHERLSRPWRMKWLVEREPKMFAYKSENSWDGICRIECIKDARTETVIVCEDIRENPGRSTTNNIELIAAQLCISFYIDPEKLVLIDHAEYSDGVSEWHRVDFEKASFSGFQNPKWEPLEDEDWRYYGIQPRRRGTPKYPTPSLFVPYKWNK